MATSGSVDYAATRDDIIKEALEILGVLGEGQSPSANQLTSCSTTLNYLVKSMQNRVKHLHVMTDVFLFTNTTSSTYTIDASTAHATTSYTQTAMKVAGAATDGTIDVDSITGISSSDNIGIELDDGTRQWTTVNGAPSGDTVTLTASLTGAAAVGKTVLVYTTKADVPHRISQVFERNISTPATPVDTPVRVLAREDYINLSNKNATGRVNQIYLDYQRSSILADVWPVSSDVNSILVMKAWRKLQDFDAASDDADFPQHWFLALSTLLALKLAPKYGYPPQETMLLKARAEEELMDAEAEESEEYIQIMPDYN